jgi:diguanylate cyclase (GGDEF)-like protein
VLDLVTLRVAFGLVAVCVLVLFYGVTYRSTRSTYSGWWCLSILFFVISAALFLLNGTPAQAVANPLGNATGVLGAACVWAAARSLRARAFGWWELGVLPPIVLIAGAIDDPAHNVWAGGAVFLTAMALLIGRSAFELAWVPEEAGASLELRSQHRFAIRSMTVVSAIISAYYLARAVAFVAVGPKHDVFVRFFGGQVTTLLIMLLLVVTTFSMSALSHEQQTDELRRQATRDGLTGLLNRAAFYRAAQRELDRGRIGKEAAVVLADLDRFKNVNDGSGHAAGDQALTFFADVCREVVGGRGLLGRLGGDEFVLLTLEGRAEDLTSAIARRYAEDVDMPTVSFGIAGVLAGDDAALAVARADHALYRAKAAGRARAVRHDDRPPFLVGGRRSA